MGAEGRAWTLEMFTWDRVIARDARHVMREVFWGTVDVNRLKHAWTT